MIEICVKIIFGDYTMDWQEQEYHEERISNFKWAFKTAIEGYGSQTVRPLTVECEYYPDTQKFKIVDFTAEHRIRIERQLQMNPKFVKEYLK